MNNPYADKILKTIRNLGHKYSTWNVFSDFVELGALTIANSVDKNKEIWEKREKQYLEIIGKYRHDEQKQLSEMFGELVEALQHEVTWSNAPVDVLGKLFHDLELHNKYKGQFFTPQHVCDMMGAMVLGDSQDRIKEKGYITLAEPCCGSGAMILGCAKAMMESELNYCDRLVVTATDIDAKCVHMCYLQLALYGIPAVVIHGNMITMEEWSHWFTPVYIFNGWQRRLRAVNKLDAPLPKQEPKKSEQLTLLEEEDE